MTGHWIAFMLGFLLDLLLGDPYWLPHPIRLIGTAIGRLERIWNKPDRTKKQKLWLGGAMVLVMLWGTLLVSFGILTLAYYIHPYLGIAAETIMTYQILATKCLRVESMKVYRELKKQDLEGARKAVSMIVGRDTEKLDEIGVAKAAIETVAENTSDGVIAPMLCLALGGPALGFFYKTINTMDSMVGYKNERYFYFGRAAAKLDDLANYIPARISGWLMIAAAGILSVCTGRKPDGTRICSGRRAARIYLRDRRNHASPNSAHTEAACAGALGIRLAGPASYFGREVKKPYIGDAGRAVEYEDIRRANRLLYGTALLCWLICIALLGTVTYLTGMGI